MTAIRIKRLQLKLSDRETAYRVQSLVEESLRLSGQDGGERLYVLRKLDLGSIDQGLNARTIALLGEMIAKAVPAESETSIGADAVFFASRDAATLALLACLLRGVTPSAWFWTKAVPEWRRGASDAAMQLMIKLQGSPKGRINLGSVLGRLIGSGALPTILRLISDQDAIRLLNIWPGQVSLISTAQTVGSELTSNFSYIRTTKQRSNEPTSVHHTIIDGCRSLDLATLNLLPTSDAVRQWLLMALLPALMPHLADNVAAVLASTRQFNEQLSKRSAPANTIITPIFDGAPDAVILRSPATVEADLQISAAQDTLKIGPPPDQIIATAQIVHHEECSVAAGLFYLVRPLRILGYERWLQSHPEQAALQHGLHLLYHIAQRHHVPPHDPVWKLLPTEPEPSLDTSSWRVALDRWLRKRCRMSLSRVVKRDGWFAISEDHIALRFPLAAADVKLRRQGVDIDPGFVPWLGRSLSFAYEDKA